MVKAASNQLENPEGFPTHECKAYGGDKIPLNPKKHSDCPYCGTSL